MRRILTMLVILICILGCAFVVGCSNQNVISDDTTMVAYNAYVAYAEESGEYVLSYEEWLATIKGEKGDKGETGEQGPQGEKGETGAQGPKGEDGHSPVVTIGENGNWFIDGVDTNQSAQYGKGEKGEDGHSPVVTIGENGNWFIDGEDTGCPTQGEKGDTGEQGEAGNSSYIGENGNWWVGDEDTGICATEKNMDRIGTDGLLFRTTIRGGVAGYEVYSYVGTMTDIIIPNYIFNQPVVSIAQGALPSKMTSVSISSNTQWVPSFANYSYLKSFDFNNAPVDTTSVSMFEGCESLEQLENYGNLRHIAANTFAETKIINFDFSNIVTIGNYAFSDCNITDYAITKEEPKLFVYIPENVTAIGTGAFEENIAIYYAGSSCVFNEELLYRNVKHSEEGYYYIDNGLTCSIINYDGINGSKIVIPSVIDGNIVTEISNYAFYFNPYIERVEIPSTVNKVGKCTFVACKNLYGVFVPNSVEDCGVFDDVCERQEYGFENTTIFFEATTFDFAGGITSPGGLGLVKYKVGIKPDDIIDDDVCIYVKKELSYEVVTIKNKAGTATIPAFVNALPVIRIGTFAIYGDTLTRGVNISNGVDKISTQAFYANSNLVFINVPSSVGAVNYRGFYSLDSCTVFIARATIPSDWDSSWYYDINGYKLNSEMYNAQDYLYEIVDGKVYLVKYIGEVVPQKAIFVPSTIDGKKVYGIRAYCYEGNASNSSSNKYKFVIPSTIEVIESRAINLYNYGYCDIFLSFSSASNVPSTWSSTFACSKSGYTSYVAIHYSGSWELLYGAPIIK